MEILEQKITLKSSCDLIGKGKDIFSPLKEAITNSLDAISQRQNAGENLGRADKARASLRNPDTARKLHDKYKR